MEDGVRKQVALSSRGRWDAEGELEPSFGWKLINTRMYAPSGWGRDSGSTSRPTLGQRPGQDVPPARVDSVEVLAGGGGQSTRVSLSAATLYLSAAGVHPSIPYGVYTGHTTACSCRCCRRSQALAGTALCIPSRLGCISPRSRSSQAPTDNLRRGHRFELSDVNKPTFTSAASRESGNVLASHSPCYDARSAPAKSISVAVIRVADEPLMRATSHCISMTVGTKSHRCTPYCHRLSGCFVPSRQGLGGLELR